MKPPHGAQARFFAFRAECPLDVQAFAQMLRFVAEGADDIDLHPGPPDPKTGVIDVELCVPGTITRETVLGAMQSVPESQLMQQTLRELGPANADRP